MFTEKVEDAYKYLSSSIAIDGPLSTQTHTNYLVHGIADNKTQIINLCWCILGFFDTMEEIDMRIESTLGPDAVARDSLYRILCKRLWVNRSLSENQKINNRNPLLQEIIGHVLVHINRRKLILPLWLGETKGCRNPHFNANDTGIDLIAIGLFTKEFLPIIGEIKAYEKEPLNAFNIACEKFSEVQDGDYDDEIRRDLKNLSRNGGISIDDLANSIWMNKSNFGAIIGYDVNFQFDVATPCDRKNVRLQCPEKLYLISTAFEKMQTLFDYISETLVLLATSLGEK
ncbi:MAG: hypothetical protein ABFD14_08315 [Anaerolineaceae bacterium]